MKFALVIIESGTSTADTQALRNFAGSLQTAGLQMPPNTMLNEGAYLLPLRNGLRGLNVLVSQAQGYGLRTHTLLLDEAPDFVVTEP